MSTEADSFMSTILTWHFSKSKDRNICISDMDILFGLILGGGHGKMKFLSKNPAFFTRNWVILVAAATNPHFYVPLHKKSGKWQLKTGSNL